MTGAVFGAAATALTAVLGYLGVLYTGRASRAADKQAQVIDARRADTESWNWLTMHVRSRLETAEQNIRDLRSRLDSKEAAERVLSDHVDTLEAHIWAKAPPPPPPRPDLSGRNAS